MISPLFPSLTTRRQFLRLAAVGLAASSLGSCRRTEDGEDSSATQSKGKYFWSGIGFGIELSLELYGVDEQTGDEIGRYTEEMIQQVEAAFSLYREDSELSRLNRDRELLQPSALFVRLCSQAEELSVATLGYYQPTIHAVWQYLQAEGQVGSPHWQQLCTVASLDNLARTEVGYQLTHPLVQLSFNAIAQGFLTDLVASHLQEIGVSSALLHLGESYAVGLHPEERPWRLAVQGTVVDGVEPVVGSMQLANQGLAVSARDKSHLLINPVAATVEGNDRVVAVATTRGATVADAFATALGVAPENQWQAILKNLNSTGRSQVKIWINNQQVACPSTLRNYPEAKVVDRSAQGIEPTGGGA